MKGIFILINKSIEIFFDSLFPPSEHTLRARKITEETLQDIFAPDVYQNVHTMCSYKNPLVKSAIWELKYRDNRRIAKVVGMLLGKTLLADIKKPHLIIPIPLSPKRYRERGYNQVERLASPALKHHPHLILRTDILHRNHYTTSQTRLSRHERLRNLQDAFFVQDPSHVQGRDIILLDDVVTTGATLHHARNTLLRAGARSVTLIAVAH